MAKIELPKYRDHRPTQFDPHKLINGSTEREEWLMVPVSRTRDSEALAESNFEAAVKALGGEGPDVEIHRFGHWGPGWYEILIVRPGSKAEDAACEIAAALEDYPVLDESDHSAREYEAEIEAWNSWGADDFRKHIQKVCTLEDDAVVELVDAKDDVLHSVFRDAGGECEHSDDGGPSFRASNITIEALQTALTETPGVGMGRRADGSGFCEGVKHAPVWYFQRRGFACRRVLLSRSSRSSACSKLR